MQLWILYFSVISECNYKKLANGYPVFNETIYLSKKNKMFISKTNIFENISLAKYDKTYKMLN